MNQTLFYDFLVNFQFICQQAIFQFAEGKDVKDDKNQQNEVVNPAGNPEKQENKQKRRKRKLEPKDPNAPKKPRPAFSYYFQQQSKEYKQLHPNHTGCQLAQIIGQKWQDLTEEEQKKFIDLAKMDRTRYQNEQETYQEKQNNCPDNKDLTIKKKRQRKIKKDILKQEYKDDN